MADAALWLQRAPADRPDAEWLGPARALPAEREVSDSGRVPVADKGVTGAARGRPLAGQDRRDAAAHRRRDGGERAGRDAGAAGQGTSTRGACGNHLAQRRGKLRWPLVAGNDCVDGSGGRSALAGQCCKPSPAAADGGDSRAVSAQRADSRLEYPGAAHDEDALALGLSAVRSRVAGGFDLVVVGELNVDVIVDCGDAVPLFGQVDQRVGHLELTLGSSGAITAVAAARLGLRTAIAGVVADDIFGRFILAELRAAGVDTSACRLRHRGATGATVVLARGTDRAMLTSPGLMGDLAASEVSVRLLASARHVHVSSFYLQDRLRAGLPAILAAARSGGATTTLDPGWDPAGAWTPGLDAVLGQLDFFLPNEAEACRITGEDDARAAAARLGGKGRTVVVKRGADGVLVHSGSRAWSLAAASVRPLDSTGAGDNFDAGFIAGLAAGLDIRTAAAIGAACGAIATQGYGGTGRTARAGEAWRLASMLLGPAGGSALPAEER